MLVFWVISYACISLGITLYASRSIESGEFSNSSYKLPSPMVIGALCATFLGAESLLCNPGMYIRNGLLPSLADPIGGTLSLVFVGLFFARPWYKKHHSTICGALEEQFGKKIAWIAGLPIGLSYIGWLAAQIAAMGVLLHVLSNNLIPYNISMLLGFLLIFLYTFWDTTSTSSALSDTVQLLIIFISLIWIMTDVYMSLDQAQTALLSSLPPSFTLATQHKTHEISLLFSGIITTCCASIPQQDLYQNVLSAKDENTAKHSIAMSSAIFLLLATLPIILLHTAHVITPDLLTKFSALEADMVLPSFIIEQASPIAKILFFGGLITAITSTTSNCLLIPAHIFIQNVLSKHTNFVENITPNQKIVLLRFISLLCGLLITIGCILYFDKLHHVTRTLYELCVVIVIVPMVAALLFKKSSILGAALSISMGLFFWLLFQCIYITSSPLLPVASGLIASNIGMLLGSLLSSMRPVIYTSSLNKKLF